MFAMLVEQCRCVERGAAESPVRRRFLPSVELVETRRVALRIATIPSVELVEPPRAAMRIATIPLVELVETR